MRKTWLVALTLMPALWVGRSVVCADVPDFANYFVGTWTCVSQYGSNIVKAYGDSPDNNSLDLWNSFVTTSGSVGTISEHYTQHGTTTTAVSSLTPHLPLVASDSSFAGGTLIFSGVQKLSQGARYQRMIYTRVDHNNFTRAFQSSTNAGGPFEITSSEKCVRLSGAPASTHARSIDYR